MLTPAAGSARYRYCGEVDVQTKALLAKGGWFSVAAPNDRKPLQKKAARIFLLKL